MDFDFSEEQYMFRDATRGVLDKAWPFERVRALGDGAEFDKTLWDTLVEQGIFAMLVPEEHAGLGLNFIDLALIVEAFGSALVPAAIIETLAVTEILARFGTEAQKREKLPGLAEGRLRSAIAWQEPDAGFSPDEIRLTARRSGDRWTISGKKILVAEAEAADFLVVPLRLDDGGPLCLAMIEPGREGIAIEPETALDLTSRYFTVAFDEVSITSDDLLGGEGVCASVERLFDVSATLAALFMTGVAAKMLDTAVHYVKQREQFGRAIGSFQAIKHRCADMAVAIESARSAAYYAAWALAEDAPDRARAVSMAKSYCGDTARFVCNEGIQLHGGIGFTWELGLHLYLRRVKALEFAFGDAAWHRERVVASTLSDISGKAA